MNAFLRQVKKFFSSRPLQFGLIALVSAGLIAGCGDDGNGNGNGDTGTEETGATEGGTTQVDMALSFPRSIYWSPLLIAESEGMFQEEGVEVQVEETEGSGFVTQQVIAGNVEVGWAAAPDAIVAYSQDPTLRTLMCNPPRNIFQIAVPEGSDITSLEQLEGQVLGVTEIGGGEMPIVNAALESVGLVPNEDVEIQPIGAAGPQAVEALESGRVQAYATSYIDLSVLTADENLAFTDILPEEFQVLPGDCMVVKQEMLEGEQRETTLGIARAWAKGTAFMRANRDATLEIGCEAVPEECENMAFAEQFIDDTLELSEPAEEGLPIGVVPPEAWDATAELLRENDTIQGQVDMERFAYSPEIMEFQEEYMEFDEQAVIEQAEGAGGGGAGAGGNGGGNGGDREGA